MSSTISEIKKETNERIFSRNLPSLPLQPYLDIRPLNSKYTKLPIVEPRQLNFPVALNKYKPYNIHEIFNPGTRNAPFSGYAQNINIESDLKGQIYALQKCSQSVYIPSSSSDLYNSTFIIKSTASTNNNGDHNLLFHKDKFATFDPNPNSKYIGVQTWGNPTRVQLKEAGEDTYCNSKNTTKTSTSKK